jgi:hypothetical protein
MGIRSALLRLLPFAVGAVAGIALVVSLAPAPRSSVPELGPGMRKAAEPAASAALISLIAADDVGALAERLTAEELQALSDSLDPVVEIHEIRFVDALMLEGDSDIVVAYVATGLNNQGQDVVSGLTLRVRDDTVVIAN